MTLDLEAYWMGRDHQFPDELTETILSNGEETVMRINRLVDRYVATTGFKRPETWASGWRPKGVNAATSNAASGSKHIMALAGDVRDPTRLFTKWCYGRPHELEACNLWMEDPRWTKSWCHLQTVPPGSGRRVYVPSSNPPTCEVPR